MPPMPPSADADSHRISRLLPLRPIEFFVLAALRGGPLHGYGLVTEIESLTEGRVRPRPGDLYRVLFRLEQRQLLVRDDGQGPVAEGAAGDERRTCYRMTTLGEQVARAEAELMSRVASGVLDPI